MVKHGYNSLASTLSFFLSLSLSLFLSLSLSLSLFFSSPLTLPSLCVFHSNRSVRLSQVYCISAVCGYCRYTVLSQLVAITVQIDIRVLSISFSFFFFLFLSLYLSLSLSNSPFSLCFLFRSTRLLQVYCISAVRGYCRYTVLSLLFAITAQERLGGKDCEKMCRSWWSP